MEDLIYILVLVAFFGIAAAYVRFCDHLSRPQEDER
jgi:hypothetical protein